MRQLLAVLILISLYAVPADAAWARVGSIRTGPDSSGTTVDVSSSTYGSGNLLLVFAAFEDVTPEPSCSASGGGNTYIEITPHPSPHGVHGCLLYDASSASGTYTITITFSGSVAFSRAVAFEYSGIDTGSPLRDSDTGDSVAATSITTGTVTTSIANSLIVVCIGLYGSRTTTETGSNWSQRDSDTSTTWKVYDRDATSVTDYSVTASTPEHITISSSEAFVSIIAVFDPASGGGGGTTPRIMTLGVGGNQ